MVGTLLFGAWISVLLEDGMNFSGNPQGLFVSLAVDRRRFRWRVPNNTTAVTRQVQPAKPT